MAQDPDLQHLEDALPGFLESRKLIKANNDSPGVLHFVGDKFVFYRFANRYRMALQFRGVTLEGFGKETEQGYSALTRIFLVWSVFERYTEMAGVHPPYKPFFLHVPKSELGALARVIDRNDPERRLFDFLRRQVRDEIHKKSLDRFRGGDDWAVVYYASALRHIYVHGHLTAAAQGCTGAQVGMICNEVSRSLLHWIGKDFARRLKIAKGAPGRR